MLLAILAAGTGLAALTYLGRLREPRSWWAAVARAVACIAVLLLLFDPGRPGQSGTRPLVLLDRSLSLQAAGGQADSAGRLAASLGDTVAFGALRPGLPGSRSHLRAALDDALATGRQVVVVTDGEIADRDLLGSEQLSAVAVHTVPRIPGADFTIAAVTGPTRLSTGDTLHLELVVQRHDPAGTITQASLEILDSGEVVHRQDLAIADRDRMRVSVAFPWPARRTGGRWLTLALQAPGDEEPANDHRWWRLHVQETPGIVVVVTRPDWDGRALYQALQHTAEVPVAGYVELQSGRWFRMRDLREVPTAEVTRAARAADLLAVRGDPAPWRGMARSRLLWRPASDIGEWFVQPGEGAHPLAGAWAGIDPDSLPPLAVADPGAVGADSWVGVSVRRGRRGAVVPAWVGREGPQGRTVELGVDGLSRWAQRGGGAAQGWHALVAASTDWLLGGAVGDSGQAVPLSPVTEQGVPVLFRWVAGGAPQALPLTITDSADRVMQDTLRFDGEGVARLALPVGHYRYQLADGGAGVFAVEPWSSEWAPGPVTLAAQEATAASALSRQSWRSTSTLFAVAVLALVAEWLLRRRVHLV